MSRFKRISAMMLCAAILFSFCVPALAAGNGPVRIAFIDTGVSLLHIDGSKVAEGENYVFPSADTVDRIGHGTATAGMVLGSADLGIEGLCPDAEVVPLVVVDKYPSGAQENGGMKALCSALEDAVDKYDCRIINVSLGITEDCSELREAVAHAEEKGVVIVAAAGNSGDKDGENYYPALYPTVISVGAANGYKKAAFSVTGDVDILYQGVNLPSVTIKDQPIPGSVNGTSFSCACVTGICARLLSDNPDWTPEKLRTELFTMAEDIGTPGYDMESGWGVLVLKDEPETAPSNPPEEDPVLPDIPTVFSDVPKGEWYTEAVEFCAENGLMNGTSDTLFSPLETTSRAMLTTVLYRIAMKDETVSGTPKEVLTMYKDGEKIPAYAAAAVTWATAAGIVGGYDDGCFGPDAPVTREQFVTILYRFTHFMGYEIDGNSGDLSPFADHSDVSGYAVSAMEWGIGAGIVSGDGANLMPRGNTNRAQTAMFLCRFCEKSGI